jgi:glycerophosphoryl diester phosphodiesterase
MPDPLTMRQRFERARAEGVPLVGGHRGNSAELPENTLPAYESAVELGVDVIECDVHLTADGELIVIHDHTLNRTTDATGFVGQRTLAELRALDAGGGERLPLLEEVCAVARDRVGLCVETKQMPVPYPGLEEKLVAELRRLDMVAQTCVISFRHGSALCVKELEPGLQVGVITGALPVDPVHVLTSARADIYAPHWAAMDPELVGVVHEAGGVVGCWTVDDETSAAWCRACMPDSVFTNRPREILPLLRGA